MLPHNAAWLLSVVLSLSKCRTMWALFGVLGLWSNHSYT